MSFTEPTGPPATAKQLAYLEALLRKVGYMSYADARRPLGLTARQGRGKFTIPEASALIDRLTAEEDAPTTEEAGPDTAAGGPAPLPRRDDRLPSGSAGLADRPLADVGSDALAAELRARGWDVSPPP